MRKWILLVLISCALVLVGCHRKADPVYHDNQGQSFKFSKLAGKWVFINYWATWCHACVKEMNDLNQFYWQNKNKKAVILGVNYDGLQSKELSKAVKRMGIQFPVLLENPASSLQLKTVGVVPTTFVINPDGDVVKTLLGPQTLKSLDLVMKDT